MSNLINPHGLDLGRTLQRRLAEAEAEIARMEDVLEIVAAGPIRGEPMARWINHMMAKARAALSRPHATKGDEG